MTIKRLNMCLLVLFFALVSCTSQSNVGSLDLIVLYQGEKLTICSNQLNWRLKTGERAVREQTAPCTDVTYNGDDVSISDQEGRPPRSVRDLAGESVPLQKGTFRVAKRESSFSKGYVYRSIQPTSRYGVLAQITVQAEGQASRKIEFTAEIGQDGYLTLAFGNRTVSVGHTPTREDIEFASAVFHLAGASDHPKLVEAVKIARDTGNWQFRKPASLLTDDNGRLNPSSKIDTADIQIDLSPLTVTLHWPGSEVSVINTATSNSIIIKTDGQAFELVSRQQGAFLFAAVGWLVSAAAYLVTEWVLPAIFNAAMDHLKAKLVAAVLSPDLQAAIASISNVLNLVDRVKSLSVSLDTFLAKNTLRLPDMKVDVRSLLPNIDLKLQLGGQDRVVLNTPLSGSEEVYPSANGNNWQGSVPVSFSPISAVDKIPTGREVCFPFKCIQTYTVPQLDLDLSTVNYPGRGPTVPNCTAAESPFSYFTNYLPVEYIDLAEINSTEKISTYLSISDFAKPRFNNSGAEDAAVKRSFGGRFLAITPQMVTVANQLFLVAAAAGKTLRISSANRNPHHNAMLGGSAQCSEHLSGGAIDAFEGTGEAIVPLYNNLVLMKEIERMMLAGQIQYVTWAYADEHTHISTGRPSVDPDSLREVQAQIRRLEKTISPVDAWTFVYAAIPEFTSLTHTTSGRSSQQWRWCCWYETAAASGSGTIEFETSYPQAAIHIEFVGVPERPFEYFHMPNVRLQLSCNFPLNAKRNQFATAPGDYVAYYAGRYACSYSWEGKSYQTFGHVDFGVTLLVTFPKGTPRTIWRNTVPINADGRTLQQILGDFPQANQEALLQMVPKDAFSESVVPYLIPSRNEAYNPEITWGIAGDKIAVFGK